jgi:hypothetical protein
VRCLCAIALLFVGFAHEVPDIGDYPIPLNELAQYTLPDGTVPILCLPSEDGGKSHERHGYKAGCEACRLGAHTLLQAPSDTVGLRLLREADRFAPLRKEAFYRRLFPPNTAPRGPPTFS